MKPGWEELVARVRGLSGHLLGRSRLMALAGTRDLIQLAAALEEAYGAASGAISGSSAEQLEIAVRRAAARYMRVIARWCGSRARYLAPLFLDEDRRSIRALLRGTAAAVPALERLAGLVPTPAIPEKALEELARQPSVREVVALLVLWGHPLGLPLLTEALRPHPDLLRLDLLLNTEYATRSARAVRRAPLGNAVRRDLMALVRETIDLENASTALQLAAQRSTTEAAQFFIPEGQSLDRATFLAAAAATNAARAASVLGRAFRGTPFAPVFTASARRPFEDAALASELRRSADAARRSPLGVAPVIAFVARLHAEVRDLRYIIWRSALGAPPAPADALVTIA